MGLVVEDVYHGLSVMSKVSCFCNISDVLAAVLEAIELAKDFKVVYLGHSSSLSGSTRFTQRPVQLHILWCTAGAGSQVKRFGCGLSTLHMAYMYSILSICLCLLTVAGTNICT